MESDESDLRRTEVNGGHVSERGEGRRMAISPRARGYANAQLDDYKGTIGPRFRWRPGTNFVARARFSGDAATLVGTAGFGFWNAPFGPGTGARVRLPRAVWFFYASNESNLPLAPVGEQGNGWFAATIDAQSARALRWAPLIVPVLILNQFFALRRILWPLIRRDLNISFERLDVSMRAWRTYRIEWLSERTIFTVDGTPVLATPRSVQGPLGFVTWIDNQTMVLTPRGKMSWKTEPVTRAQWLEIDGMVVEPAD